MPKTNAVKSYDLMPVLPEARITCPKCDACIAEIDPKWIGLASISEGNKGNPWAKIRRLCLDAFKEFGPLKGWMTQGECPEKECDGKWWDGEKLYVTVPSHLKKAKEA